MNTVLIKCPRCNLEAEALLEEDFYKFILYKCPRCGSNVVCYENKIGVISNKIVKKLIQSKKLKFCGNICFTQVSKSSKKSSPSKDAISKDDILNLKIFLETEQDSAKIITSL